MTGLWNFLADWCLTNRSGYPVIDGMWLTEGDPSWGYIDGDNGPWVMGRGFPPRWLWR